MTEELRARAIRALLNARGIGGVRFSKVYVVCDEFTFSHKIAKTIQKGMRRKEIVKSVAFMSDDDMDAQVVNECVYHIPPVEEIGYEEAYMEKTGATSVPEEFSRTVFGEFDEMIVTESTCFTANHANLRFLTDEVEDAWNKAKSYVQGQEAAAREAEIEARERRQMMYEMGYMDK